MTSHSGSVNYPTDWQEIEAIRCLICLEKLGTYGGLAALACGHRGCVECLRQVKASHVIARCPLCQTPIKEDIKPPASGDLDQSLQFEWADSPSFDEKTDEFGLANSQQEGANFDTLQSEQKFQPCVYDEFDTWTPGSQPIESMDETANDCTQWPSDDNRAEVRRGQLDINTKNVEIGSAFTSMVPVSFNARRYTKEENLSMVLDDTWASVHVPSAPPLLGNTLRSVLDAEPPQWIPDSARSSCMQCRARFQPLRRPRHHCRFCGGIFCKSCSKGKCLLPLKFMQRDPQRVCDSCYESLEPVQGFLVTVNSNASQIAVHDVTDLTCMRGWLNNPIGLSMQDEIYKATCTLRNFCKVGAMRAEERIPEVVLQGAKGLAILTVVKVGVVLTYKVGTGLLVARKDDGSWSAPAAIMSFGLGWGFQAGGELVDFVIVLRSTKAVKAFSSRAHLSVGAGMSAAVGPLGRLAEADIRVGDRGAASCYSYSCSQGAFAGVSFEGNVVMSRAEANTRFYGDMYVTPEYILFGAIPVPKAAAPLYKALQELFRDVDA